MLGDLVTDKAARIAEYKRRNARFVSRTITENQWEAYQSEGWEWVRQNKSGPAIRKAKPLDEILENDFWAVLYHFGYRALNAGRKFTIEITQHGGNTVRKQIDVFAYDDETVVVAECKASATRRKWSLQKDLGEFEANKGPIARALTKTLGEPFTRKVIWAFVTRNVEWSKNDRARASEFNIRVITELEMRYFSEIAKRLGPAGRFQFHAEYLARTKIAALKDATVPAIKTKIGGTWAYFFVAPPRKLLPIAFVNHRDLRDPEAAPSYQRLITRARLQSIAKFIKSGGYFANALLVNFKDKVQFNRAAPETDDGTTLGTLTLPNQYKSMWIIDGQHRLYAYAENNEDDPRHQVPVIAFDNLDQNEEGRLFKTINSEQKRVSPNLLDELQGEQELHSPDKQRQMRAIASRTIEQLRFEIGGPFDERFKSAELPGSPERPLTLTSICSAIVTSGLLGRMKAGADLRFIQGPLSRETPAKTIDAASSALSAHFGHIRDANEMRWAAGKPGNVCSNIGVEAHIRLLAELAKFVQVKSGMDPRELDEGELVQIIAGYLAPVLAYIKKTAGEEFDQHFKVPPGSGGPARYFYKLALLVRANEPTFSPSGLEDYIRETAVSRTERADKQIRAIQEKVPAFVIRRLKEIYPLPGDKFLRKAIKNQDILTEAFKKQGSADPDDDAPLETYIDFIEFRKIIETQENWPHFLDSMSILLPHEK